MDGREDGIEPCEMDREPFGTGQVPTDRADDPASICVPVVLPNLPWALRGTIRPERTVGEIRRNLILLISLQLDLISFQLD